jgi:hypothetical protein
MSKAEQKLPFVTELADGFIAVIQSWLDEDELRMVRHRNRRQVAETGHGCATHDFCDANMAMHEAWVKLTGQNPLDFQDEEAGGMDQVTTTLWNRAWDLAIRLEFK